jgi:TrmH family RNA methyltransferase
LRLVTSRANPRIKQLRLLADSARERRQSGLTLLDGVHLVEAAGAAGLVPIELIVSEHGASQREITALLERLPAVPALMVPDSLFAEISPVDTPSGLLALISVPEVTPRDGSSASLVLLDGVQDPGNLGTIIRTAAAAGIRDVLLTTGCTQAWSPRALRAGMGGHFRLSVHERIEADLELRDFPGPIVATGVGPGAVALYERDLRGGPVAWLFGAEGAGLSAAVAALATEMVTIPMPGEVESLNVGAAVAICLFEQVRQRRATS